MAEAIVGSDGRRHPNAAAREVAEGALLEDAWRSSVASAGETTAPSSRMEQSVDVGGALLQLVPSSSQLDVDPEFRFDPARRMLPSRPSTTGQAGRGLPLTLAMQASRGRELVP